MDSTKRADILRVTGRSKSLNFANVKSSRLSLSISSVRESESRGNDVHVTLRMTERATTSDRESAMSEATITIPPRITLEEIETLLELSPESKECVRRLHDYQLPQFNLSVIHIKFRHN